MAFTFAADWNAPGNHSPVVTMTTAQEVENVVVSCCVSKTSTDSNITGLLGLITTVSTQCEVQKGLHQDETRGTLGTEKHVRIRAPIGVGNYITFHLYIATLAVTIGRGKNKKNSAINSMSKITYYHGSALHTAPF
jgi:hypothetical protein